MKEHSFLFNELFDSIVKINIKLKGYNSNNKAFMRKAGINAYMRKFSIELEKLVEDYYSKNNNSSLEEINVYSASTYFHFKLKADSDNSWPPKSRMTLSYMAKALFSHTWQEINCLNDDKIRSTMIITLKNSIIHAVEEALENDDIQRVVEWEYNTNPEKFIDTVVSIALEDDWYTVLYNMLYSYDRKKQKFIIVNADSELTYNKLKKMCIKLQMAFGKIPSKESDCESLSIIPMNNSSVSKLISENELKELSDGNVIFFIMGDEVNDKTWNILRYVVNKQESKRSDIRIFQKFDVDIDETEIINLFQAARKLNVDIREYHNSVEVFVLMVQMISEILDDRNSIKVSNKKLIVNGIDVLDLDKHRIYNSKLIEDIKSKLDCYSMLNDRIPLFLSEFDNTVNLYEECTSQLLSLSFAGLEEDKNIQILSDVQLKKIFNDSKNTISIEKKRIKEVIASKRQQIYNIKESDPDSTERICEIYDDLVRIVMEIGIEYTILYEYSTYLMKIGRLDDSIAVIKKLIMIYELYGDIESINTVDIFLHAGKIYNILYEYENAIDMYLMAEKYCDMSITGRYIAIKCKLKIFQFYYVLGDFIKMIDYLDMAVQEAESICPDLDDKTISLEGKEILAYIAYCQGQLQSAMFNRENTIGYYSYAINLYREIMNESKNNPDLYLRSMIALSSAYCNLGVTYYRADSYDKARECYLQGLDICDKILNIDQYSSIVYIKLGINNGLNCLYLGMIDEAEKSFQQAYRVIQTLNKVERERMASAEQSCITVLSRIKARIETDSNLDSATI